MKLLLGSNNQNKAKEIKSIIGIYSPNNDIELVLPKNILNQNYDVDETGSTLEENAKLKSEFFFELTKIPTIADDTGLEIPYLGGKPGVHSARFSGVYGNDKANREKVLNLLSNATNNNRNAQFRTVICYTDEKGSWFADGICKGKINNLELGSEGFGYDSIFVPNGYDQTFAQMALIQKNSISHRKLAIENFIRLFLDYIRH